MTAGGPEDIAGPQSLTNGLIDEIRVLGMYLQ
jgi:hypothetical protein